MALLFKVNNGKCFATREFIGGRPSPMLVAH